MTTIFVHLNDERRATRLLRTALAVAAAMGGPTHVVGFHLVPAFPQLPPMAVPYAGEVLGVAIAEDRRSGETLHTMFMEAMAGQPVVAEWRAVEAAHADLAGITAHHARVSDLVIASQSDEDWDLSPVLDFPDRLVLLTGRPLLVVPNVGDTWSGGKPAVVAWNRSREAARAMFDARPLLRCASRVDVVGLTAPARRLPEPELDVTAALVRHGIKAEAVQLVASEAEQGEVILSALADRGAELLVMGAWGHSRLHELVFGGVTRHILRHMTVPVLLSH